ncbi:MAG: hypothetical protein AABX05_01145, partial [Nanoarchaeota archaeon]
EKNYDKFLSEIVITPESMEEYQRRVGYSVEMVDTGVQNKGLTLYRNTAHFVTGTITTSYLLNLEFHQVKRRLVESGIEAIVKVQPIGNSGFYGLPVAKKKDQGPYR